MLCNFLRIPWYITIVSCCSRLYHHHHHVHVRVLQPQLLTYILHSAYICSTTTITIIIIPCKRQRECPSSRGFPCVRRTSDVVSEGNNSPPLQFKSCAVLDWNDCTWSYTNKLPSESSMTTVLWMSHGDILQVPLESGVSRRDVLLGCVSLCPCPASAFI